MALDDNSGARPAGPVVLRIKLRYDDVDAMVHRFAPNVGKSGLFLPTKSIQPVGTEVKFELRLANDVPVLVGLGRVKAVRHPDPENPKASFGMAIELMRVSREGREVILKMLERRRAMGLPEVAIPVPENLEMARRAEVETQPRADAAAVVREAITQAAATSVPLLTSARPGSGPIAIVRDAKSGRVPVPMLAPEKSRPRRPAVQELIDRASEISANFVMPTELDMHVDVERVLSRARALAGGDLDFELATLREAAATPHEISVEAASAELARQLGGKPIAKRDKSARWAPPPAIELRSESPRSQDFASQTRAQTEAAPSAAIAEVVAAATSTLDQTPVVEPVVAMPPLEESQPELELKTPVDASPSLVPEESYVLRKSAEIVAQEEGYLDGYHTPDPDAAPKSFGPSDVRTDPAPQRNLLIDDDADVSSFERALDAARIHTGVSAAAPERPGDHELDDEEDQRAQLLASGEYQLEDQAERTQIGAPLEEEPYPEEQEVSDLDVLAEADEDDEDLMAAHGEADVSGGHAAPSEPYQPYETPPPADDFATRLDLGDDEEPPPSDDIDRDAAREFDADAARELDADAAREVGGLPAPIEAAGYREAPAPYAYQRARRASSEPSTDYTLAESLGPSSMHFSPHETGEEFDEPHSYARESAAAPASAHGPASGPDPRLLQHGRPTTTAPSDLEDALAALDPGDIDLEQQRRRRRPTPSTQRPLPGLPMESSGSRPLPGLPIERPRTGPVPVTPAASTPRSGPHVVARSSLRNTGSQPSQSQPPHPTGPQMLHDPVDPHGRAKPPTAQQPVPPRPKQPTGQVSTAKPPPIPAAARKPTQQVPITKPPAQPAPVAPKRAPTDEGVMIDFDDDE